MDSLYIAFHGEGSTDERFFRNITERIIKGVVLTNNIPDLSIDWLILRSKGATSEETLLNAAVASKDQNLLIFHRDADRMSWQDCYDTHFKTALKSIELLPAGNVCKNIVNLIPITETEAWILCDKSLLIDILESQMTANALGLNYQISRIEELRDPKSYIETAVNLNKLNLPPRKRKYAVKRSEIYERYSQDVPLECLEQLTSYRRFKEDLLNIFDGI